MCFGEFIPLHHMRQGVVLSLETLTVATHRKSRGGYFHQGKIFATDLEPETTREKATRNKDSGVPKGKAHND